MRHLLILLIHLFGFVLLMKGLFPYTKRINIRSNQSCFDHLENISENVNSRFILLIIDALRSDYVFNVNQTFRLKSIEKFEKENILFKYELKCHSPTVTLPRLKSMLTGSIPSFWDVIYNYNTSEIDLDNLLNRYKDKYPKKKIIFYGDDTWLKLYPKEIFSRSECVQSFFVKDFHQIDLNVTKNVQRELNENNDWNLLIVHYLGLDHLGHSLGALNQLVIDKLNEYDQIIEEILSKFNENDLLIITGDHGMIDQGGHGGSSNQEILVPLIFISKRFQFLPKVQINEERNEYYQIDLTSTLSGLFQIGIPSNNLGIQIESILHKYFYRENKEFFRCLINDNQRQLIDVLQSSSSSSSLSLNNLSIQSIRDEAIRSSQKQNFLYICLSLMIFILSLFDLICVKTNQWKKKDLFIYLILFVLFELLFNDIYLSFSLTLSINLLQEIYLNRHSTNLSLLLNKIKENSSSKISLICRLIHLISLFSSSYIEEEHQLWFYFLSTNLLIRSIEEKSLMNFIEMFFLRLIRQWNQTGNKYLNQPDIKSFLQHVDHSIYLNSIDLICLSIYSLILFRRSNDRFDHLYLSPLILFILRSNLFSSSKTMLMIKFFYIYLLIELIRTGGKNWKEILYLFLYLIHRQHQSFVLLLYYLFSNSNSKRKSNFIFFLFVQSAFFHLGNSNSFVTIDISTGFVGLTSYNPFLHGCFIYLGIYLLSMIFYLETNENIREDLIKHQIIVNILYVLCLFIHRNHLFIWTVFAPKLFYQFAQTFNYFLFSIISTKILHRK